jgi:DNA-binding transcriptional MocR family regulator
VVAFATDVRAGLVTHAATTLDRDRRDASGDRRVAALANVARMADQISFARGAPSIDIVAVDDLSAAAQRAFKNDPSGSFSYGTSIGYPPLRSWIAEKHELPPEQVIVTNGSMQADAFLFELLVDESDLVVVEAPTYDRTLLSLRKRGADILAIPLEEDGIDVAALASALEAGARPKLAHIIPTFQNPAGYTLSLDKRRRLIELAQQYDFVIFEDDPYIELRFEGERLPTMLSLDSSDHVVYASSFSKTVCPGIRVGYLAGPAETIASVQKIATETYISPNMVAESIVNEFCRSGAIDNSIETVKAALRDRVQRLSAALESQLPDAKFTAPDGGYFLWVDLPEGVDVDALFAAAQDRGVVFVKGTDFLLEGGQNSLRLAYSGVTSDEIDEGVKRLAEAYNSLGS